MQCHGVWSRSLLIYCSLIKLTVTLLYNRFLFFKFGRRFRRQCSDLYTVFVQSFFMFLIFVFSISNFTDILPKSEHVIVFLTILTEHQGSDKLITLLNLNIFIFY